MKSRTSKMSAKLLVMILIFTMSFAFMAFPANAERTDSVKTDYRLTLTDKAENVRIFVPVTIKKAVTDLKKETSKLSIQLVRDTEKVYVDTSLFPNLKKGGTLESWKTSEGKPMFTDIKSTVTEIGGLKYFEVQFNKADYFGEENSVPHANGGKYLDDCGYFRLQVKSGKTIYGSVAVKVVPYANFRTMEEVYSEISQIAAYDTKLFVKEYSMGKSTGGRNIPYLIISDNKKSVDNWLKFADLAEKDPIQALADIEKGKAKDIRVPVLFSNVHANEVAATDGIMEFAWKLVKEKELPYSYIKGFTEAGKAKLQEQMGPVNTKGSTAIPDLVKDTASYLGYIKADETMFSKPVDMAKYYEMEKRNVKVTDLLKDVFFIIVPEENVDGRTYITRTAQNGYDLNRDNSFQTTSETAQMQNLIGTYNPVSFIEFHGLIPTFQCEPCDPPHEPNFEYDLLSEHLMKGGEAAGIAAIANNKKYNSYFIPQRDGLTYTGEKDQTEWLDPWDDMSTSYTPQFAMLHGTVSYTVELPGYNDAATDLVSYAMLGNADFVAKNKLGYLKSQTSIFKRGVENHNSNKLSEAGQWFADMHDVEGAEVNLFRPEYNGKGENGNFYPECYIIPLDGGLQKNLDAALKMMEWLTRNDVKVKLTEKEFTYKDVKYPKGTMIVSMYQAKRSVANGVLNDGVLIQSWNQLYSEGITAFNKTRGFDMVTVAEPAAYKDIAAVCGKDRDYKFAKDYLTKAKSYFTGITGADVIIKNVSEASTAAVNKLLKDGKKVAMITEGENKGDFICSYNDYKTVRSKYILSAKGLNGGDIKAKLISETPKVYVTGKPGQDSAGYVNTTLVAASPNWNYDRVALELMGFNRVENAKDANVVIGASKLDEAGLTAVTSGTPYIGYGRTAMTGIEGLKLDVERSALDSAMDCLGFVTYPENTLVNATYIAEKDDIFYGYGVGYFSKYPKEAKVLVQMANKKPLEGFIPTMTAAQKTAYENFLNGSVQGIEYTKDSLDVVLFANTLTNKAHQRDEYTFISNFIFSRMLGNEDYVGVPTGTPENPDVTNPGDTDDAVTALKEKLAAYSLVAKSKRVTLSNGKRGIKITWKDANGKALEFDKVQIFRSLKKNSGYGKKPIFTTAKSSYLNKSVKKNVKYFYKVRGYVELDGVKYYTKWSTKTKRVA